MYVCAAEGGRWTDRQGSQVPQSSQVALRLLLTAKPSRRQEGSKIRQPVRASCISFEIRKETLVTMIPLFQSIITSSSGALVPSHVTCHAVVRMAPRAIAASIGSGGSALTSFFLPAKVRIHCMALTVYAIL